ncbi:MAG: hypothetical protein RSE41_04885 [Clostridia bacterium]
MKIDLNKIVNAMTFQSEDVLSIIDTVDDNNILTFDKKSNELDEVYEKMDDNIYIPLPTSYEINEMSMIEDFSKINNIQLNKMKNFDKIVKLNGIENEWNKFKNDRYLEIAQDFCETNDIDYTV